MILNSILSALSNPSHPYNQQHMYVLQSLAEVKSIVLATELPHAETYIEHLFGMFFDILSGSAKSSTGEQLSKQVFFNMTSILVVLVDEMEVLPQEVVDTIIAQFVRVDSRVTPTNTNLKKGSAKTDDNQSTLELKELPPAYAMAKTICNSCEEKMAREVSKYFSDIILESTASSRENRREGGDDDDAEDSFVGASEQDLRELDKAHRLLRELWRASPAVLQNVIPQLEAELQAENVKLRQLATETLGDIVSGIGAAGPPPPPNMDPAAYPQATMASKFDYPVHVNLFTIPSAPQSFPHTFSSTYSAFRGRRQDKNPIIRAAWTTAVGRILATNAGGGGLSHGDEKALVEDLARMLNDSDEKVRLASVRAIGNFSLPDVINKLGRLGGVDKEGSVLANLSERVKDRKPAVRNEAMETMARIWGVASGEIANGNQEVIELVGGASSRILNAFYTNDPEIQVLIDKVFYEILLPLTYPPIKSKTQKTVSGNSQRVQDSQAAADTAEDGSKKKEPDELRAQRILVLLKTLDERAKKIFFSICARQVAVSRYLMAYLQSCEEYNAGVMDKDDEKIEARLTKLINEIAKFLPDHGKLSSDLWKFAKAHDRRNYQLLRFCMKPENDFRFVFNSIKEFKKRMEATNPSSGMMESFLPLIYRASIILNNRSHVPVYMDYAKTDELSLANTAHALLNEISQRSPEVLKANVKEICLSLQSEAPTESKANGPGTVESLKACAAFARRFTDEIPQDAKFVTAMNNYALYGSPPEAAKHAVSIIMASSKRKELMAKDLVKKCLQGFKYGNKGFLPRLAALSRLCLLAPDQVEEHVDVIVDLALNDILSKVRSPTEETSAEESSIQYRWSDEVDDECQAKIWAIRILVNRLRATKNDDNLTEKAATLYKILDKLIAYEGELFPEKNTPPTHKPRLRLAAARSYFKLCLSKSHDQLLLPQAFQNLAMVAQDMLVGVREGCLQRLRKYLGHNRLPPRFYTPAFLIAYEPAPKLKSETTTWLRSRAAFFAAYKSSSTDASGAVVSKTSTTLEAVFARLISLLAHHPDYGNSVEELKEFGRYLVFYLNTVASENNISLIYHVAQQVKGCSDAISLPSKRGTPKPASTTDFTERLHTLSDLATLTIRTLIENKGWALQSLPVRLTLPRSLFIEIHEHETAQQLAETDYLPDGISDEIQKVVRGALRRSGASISKKRKSTADGEGNAKKRSKMPVREKKKERSQKTPRKKKAHDWDASDDDEEEEDEATPGQSAADRMRAQLEVSRRQSSRKSNASTTQGLYRERDDSEDEEELVAANAADRPAKPKPATSSAAADEDDSELSEPAEDEDEDMPDADGEKEHEEKTVHGEQEETEASPETDAPSLSRVKGKTVQKKTPAKTPTKARTNGAPASSSTVGKISASKTKDAAKATPTRTSGRTTRSRG
jgi:sister-chromatid-cohesion protein PDS5